MSHWHSVRPVCVVTLVGVLTALSITSVFAASTEATYGTEGMVVSRSVHASAAGIQIMKAGGNAIDGAVATGFALAVTYPSAGNIGGGGFAVVRLADGTVVTLDHRERAPLTATHDMYLDDAGNVISGLSTRSHKAAGVPGSVDGLLTLLATHGTMSRAEVMAPAIRLARRGFPLDHDLVRQFKRVLPSMAAYPASVEKFSQAGTPYEVGDIWRQPDLAKVLKRISRQGRDGFYRGEVAALIVAEMQRGNGDISLTDLRDYASVWRDPVRGTYRGHEIWGMGPPSSGGVLVVQMLNMLEPYDLGSMGWGSAASVHHIVEAARRAYADRAEHLGDPDFVDIPLTSLTDKAYARTRFADFDDRAASDSDEIGPGLMDLPSESRETTHFSVADGEGNVVALTTTLNSGYGNKIVVADTGILLNNEMNDFSIKPNTPNQYELIGREANAIAPGKRMLSSMSPTIVTRDGEPVLVTGSPGGSTIIMTTLQVVINVIDHEMPIEDAVAQPRIHHQWRPERVTHERYALSKETRDALEAMGHELSASRWGRGIGDANSIEIKDGVLRGTKDPRAVGAAIGY
ncbi:MAG: gamma-glutamyltransferase [Pseudomonadota bacterium]